MFYSRRRKNLEIIMSALGKEHEKIDFKIISLDNWVLDTSEQRRRMKITEIYFARHRPTYRKQFN